MNKAQIEAAHGRMTPPSLPHDLFVIEISPTASSGVRCAAVCKAWCHHIISHVLRIRPRTDRFLSYLFLGSSPSSMPAITSGWAQCVPGPFKSALRMNRLGACCFYSLIPSASGHGVDLGSYGKLLSTRDGYLLLQKGEGDHLCLYNP